MKLRKLADGKKTSCAVKSLGVTIEQSHPRVGKVFSSNRQTIYHCVSGSYIVEQERLLCALGIFHSLLSKC